MQKKDDPSIFRMLFDLLLEVFLGTNTRELRQDVGPAWMHRLDGWFRSLPWWLRVIVGAVLVVSPVLALAVLIAVLLFLLELVELF
jgi:hypothetical protein